MRIFLDFDGVLHPGQKGDFSQIDVFRKVMGRLQYPQIVITSSLRLSMTIKELRAMFPADLARKIEGVTPEKDAFKGCVRQLEIQSYNQRNPLPFLVLDDEASLFEPGWPPLALVNSQTGLVDADVDRIYNIARGLGGDKSTRRSGLAVRPARSLMG